MTIALMLVDVQRNMLEGASPVPAAREVGPAIESLLARARAQQAVVVQVQNDGPRGDPDEPHTPGWELVFAATSADLVVRKQQQDAFASDAGFASTLRARGVDRVVVAGMQSNYCVTATIRGALRHGFRVILASGAHATYDERDAASAIAATVDAALSVEGVTVLQANEVEFV